MLFSIIKDMFTWKPEHRISYFRGGKGDSIIVNADTFVKMYKRNPQSVRGAIMVPPTIGKEDLGHFQIPITPKYEIIDEQ